LEKCYIATSHIPLAEHLMYMAHKMGNTSGVLKLSSDWLSSTGFLGDVCVNCVNAGCLEVWKVRGTIVAVNLVDALCSVIVGTSTLHFHAPKHDAEQNKL